MTVGENDMLPTEEVKCTNSDNDYLQSLIELYKNQIVLLKEELNLNKKNQGLV